MSYRKRTQRGFQFNSFEITKREILASITIIAIMLVIGFIISSKITERQEDRNEVYNKATKIESTEIFEYGIDTNIGNAFVYGKLAAVDTVDYVGEIDGEYMYVEKVKEKYTKHTKRVRHERTKSDGKKETYYTTEEYWAWDYVDSENKKCKRISFCGVEFDSDKFHLPDSSYIDTVKESKYIRYKYYGCSKEYTGTIFTSIKNNTINDTEFFNQKNISETVEYLESGIGNIVFWIFWILLICVVVFIFYYAKNEWLEDKSYIKEKLLRNGE